MSSDCRYHVSVTPCTKLTVPEGIKAVEDFHPSQLERRKWPREGNRRVPEGGIAGEIVAEKIVVTWLDDKLIYPVAEDPKPLAQKNRRYPNEITYLASFLAQLDGQVAYAPHPSSTISYLILCEDKIAQTYAIRFNSWETAIIDPFIKHSMPIPLKGTFEFEVWHRSVNAVIQLSADPAGLSSIVINLNKVNRVNEIGVRQVEYAKESTKKPPHLPHSFAKELKPLIDATSEAIQPYGRLIHEPIFLTETVTEIRWPHTESFDGLAGNLQQDFTMSWVQSESGEYLDLVFEGISGSLMGEKGRPGVNYSGELGVYRVDLIMARPDGSFYVRTSGQISPFAILVALPDKDTGEPLEHSLRAFIIRDGCAIRLDPQVWHSVPIPLAGTHSALFTEIVAGTNAHILANVKAETGHSIQFVQSI